MTRIKSFSPLPKSVTIKPYKLHGLGLFASEDIAKGITLGVSHVEDNDAQDGTVRTPLGGFVNHSYNPNVDLLDGNKEWVMVTIRDIKEGDEITVDYTPWYDAEALKTYN
jgi:SET domain-containing protein